MVIHSVSLHGYSVRAIRRIVENPLDRLSYAFGRVIDRMVQQQGLIL